MTQVRPLVIGLVNNMLSEAFAQTERQFRAILAAGAGGSAVHLRLFTLDPAAADKDAVLRYQPAAAIDPATLDGLIVTGVPPRAAALRDEPCWNELAALVDLASLHGIPAVWSCLAAHAAVLHLDGIERCRLPEKLTGLFDCVRSNEDHPITAGLPWRWRVPHSRYNDLPVTALALRGYRILSSAPEIGADLFFKDAGAPFLFCQGHPEYDAQALLREYRRDIWQFVSSRRDLYPMIPVGCFGLAATAQLEAFRARAFRDRRPEIMADFPSAACEADLAHVWGEITNAIYANWLARVVAPRVQGPRAVRAA